MNIYIYIYSSSKTEFAIKVKADRLAHSISAGGHRPASLLSSRWSMTLHSVDHVSNAWWSREGVLQSVCMLLSHSDVCVHVCGLFGVHVKTFFWKTAR